MGFRCMGRAWYVEAERKGNMRSAYPMHGPSPTVWWNIRAAHQARMKRHRRFKSTSQHASHISPHRGDEM